MLIDVQDQIDRHLVIAAESDISITLLHINHGGCPVAERHFLENALRLQAVKFVVDSRA